MDNIFHKIGSFISRQDYFLKWFILGLINGVVSHIPSPAGEEPNNLIFKPGLVYLLPIVIAFGGFIAGFLGAGLGVVYHQLFPSLVNTSHIGGFVIVGMLALFSAAGKAPVAVTLIVVEMTSSYQLLPACMLAVAVAYLISGDYSIYKSQVKTRED